MEKKLLERNIYTALVGVFMFFALIGIACITQNTGFTRTKIIFIGIIILISVIFYCLYCFSKLKFHQFVFLAVLVFCLLNSFVQPILNIPDEQAHLTHAEIVSRGVLSVDKNSENYETIQSVLDLTQDVEKTVFDSQKAMEKTNLSTAYMNAVAASHLFIYYIPQAIGIVLAKLFSLNAIWLLWLARIMASITYAFMIGFAVKIAPKCKRFLFFVAFLPMSIQQGGSVSVDVFVNGLSILFIAFFLKLYCESEHPKYKQFFIIFIILGLLQTFIKVTNICLCGLVLLLPLKERYGKKAVWIKVGSLIGFIVAGLVYYYYTTTFNGGAPSTFNVENNINSGLQLQFIMSNPIQWGYHFIGNIMKQTASQWINQLFTFGWLKCDLSYISVFFIILYIRQCYHCDELFIKDNYKLLVILMMAGTIAFTCLALYLANTPVASNELWGVQGRYFIPVLALSALLFTKKKKTLVVAPIQYDIDIALSLFLTGSMLISVVGLYY